MTSETATRTQAPGNTCRWILRDMDEGLALLEITAQTKAGPVTGRYWVERVHQGEAVIGYRLTALGDHGKSYSVRVGTRWTCSCNDFRYRHADNPRSPGCKHARSLRAALTRLYV
jgi:hypothetical protein